MNRKLYRVLKEIQNTEKKIAEWQEQLKELKLLAEQLENEEIVKTIRSMKLDSRRMLELLEGIQSGTISIPLPKLGRPETETAGGERSKPECLAEGNRTMAQETAPESEDREHEEI